MKIILDTNVLISGIFWKGSPHKVLELWSSGKVKVVATRKILNEYFEVLVRIDKSGEIAKRWRLFILENVVIIEAKNNTRFSRDPNDDMFIACALAANASHVISGDKDLLTLKKVSKTKIITASEFLIQQRKFSL